MALTRIEFLLVSSQLVSDLSKSNCRVIFFLFSISISFCLLRRYISVFSSMGVPAGRRVRFFVVVVFVDGGALWDVVGVLVAVAVVVVVVVVATEWLTDGQASLNVDRFSLSSEEVMLVAGEGTPEMVKVE